ncbi:hypothetical protein BRADI_5g01602v3 [Brachypodium distachyon]|uniref:Uncharacterized protein n=1 Tax=Brachypodium distachyon TaxID=15368 RepID=A0A0Q3E1F8_BRADI|nr:hypothetical protein BRADI_5g01602v3 [Brachypodium distachyon]
MPHLCLHPRCLSAAVATIPNSAASSPIPIRRCIRPSSFSEPGTGAMNRRQGPAASTRLRHDRCQLATSPSGGIHALVPLPKFLKRQPADSTHEKEPRSIFALILIPLPLEHLVGKERPDLPAGVNIVDRVFELTLYDLHSWRSAGCVAEF